MANFVLIHGGGHGGWCWDRLTPLLKKAGHVVHTPTLLGLAERAGERNAQTNLTTHIADVIGVFEEFNLTNVILVGHSYGGMVITGAADRLGARIAKLVYLDGAHPTNGQALIDCLPGAEERLMQGVEIIDDVALTLLPDADTIKIVYGLEAKNDIAWAKQHLTPHPLACFIEPLLLTNEAAIDRIERASIDCKNTLKLRTPELLARIASCQQRFVLDAGHDVMITRPNAVAEILLGLT